jgi:PAS domain S-box-containing protein
VASVHEGFANEFFYLTSDLLCIVSSEGYFLDVNPAWTRSLGWTREELLSRPYLEFVHPDDHPATGVAHQNAEKTQGTLQFENRYLCKEGGYRWLRWGGAFKEEKGSIWGLAEDVTDSREERHDQTALIEILHEGYVIRDASGKTIRFNQLALEILDLTEDQLSGRALTDPRWRIVDENGKSLPGELHPSMLALTTGQPQMKRVLGVILDNEEIRWVRVSSAPIFSGRGKTKPDRVLSVFQNITDEVVAQKRLEIAVSAGKFGIWEWNIRGNQVYWDDAMYEIYGVEKGQFGFNRQAVQALIFEDDRKELEAKVLKAFSTQSDYSGEFRIRRPDGNVRIIRTESKGFYDEKGFPLRHVGVNWDITEQREQEFKLIHASKMSTLGEVSAGIAHEINNPLAIILGKNHQIQNMLDRGTIDEVALQKTVGIIDQTTKRIAKIIKGLRSFARDDAMDPFERCEIHTLVEDVLSFCHARFLNRQVPLDVQNDLPYTVIECRVPQIMQVLMNLMNNAFDAVENLPMKWVRLELKDDGDFVIFRVVDSGNGIPSGIREKILQPFFTTKGIGKGTGLGLSISSGLVKSHGGTLEIDVTHPHTCFIVRLPKRQKGI